MTRKEILEAVRSGYSEFRHIWLEHKKDYGLGALVFTTDDLPDALDEVQCEYWTLSELRHYLRRMQEYDEVVYQWLNGAARGKGYPVVIFSQGSDPGCEQIHFACVTKEQVS